MVSLTFYLLLVSNWKCQAYLFLLSSTTDSSHPSTSHWVAHWKHSLFCLFHTFSLKVHPNCVDSPRNGPQWCRPPGIHIIVYLSSPVIPGLVYVTWPVYGRSDGMSLLRFGYKGYPGLCLGCNLSSLALRGVI